MFRRKKSDSDDTSAPPAPEDLAIPMRQGPRPPTALGPGRPAPAPAAAPAAPALIATPPNPQPLRLSEMQRRGSEPAGTPIIPTPRSREETRRLIVGRDISLSGEITSCERLVVEGSVEANLANCREIEVAETGLFKGSAAIDEAEIRGRFEGSLTVRKRLLVRSTGKLTGSVRYGQIEVECGGQISGDVQVQPMHEEAETRPPRTVVPMPGEPKA